jgi:hypothetical protein
MIERHAGASILRPPNIRRLAFQPWQSDPNSLLLSNGKNALYGAAKRRKIAYHSRLLIAPSLADRNPQAQVRPRCASPLIGPNGLFQIIHYICPVTASLVEERRGPR